ncbi:MAG: hypothetical protein A3J97_13455 [Spirochaetes bacterium RIFOXYC1_FULL_54_7]|nr:MAG: hypothetical protein A3J97_13455 [Spirochaetes bacterium RIFOXYC1_FULL_54_7]
MAADERAGMDTISWLLDKADPALEFQVRRDLLHEPEHSLIGLRHRIKTSAHVKLLLDERHENGHWGSGVYNPKWTCTHYVLWELVQLGIPPGNRLCRESCDLLLGFPRGEHGGINYAHTVTNSDVCINGMILNIISYFGLYTDRCNELIDYLLASQMPDGGWNCEYLRGTRHSSLHTTISVLEGLTRNLESGHPYRSGELKTARSQGIEFILEHELYKSSTTGEVIRDEFLRFCFPVRWKYDILRCLDYFQRAAIAHDPRMDAALSVVARSRDAKGRWKSFKQAGKTYRDLESVADRGKWNTLRALRVLGYFSNGLGG